MPEGYTLHRLKTQDDVAQNLELMRAVFGVDDGVDTLVEKLISKHPHMALRDHFTVKQRGRIVASLNLIPLKWSLDGVTLKVAEMGCVATHPDHREKGLQRMLNAEFDRVLAEEGYDLAAIEGIPYFYRQFGYEYALPLDEETTIPLEKIPCYKVKHRIRPFTPEDIPQAMRLLEKSQEKFLVHGIRDEEVWRMQEETGLWAERMFHGYAVEEGGELVAYFRIREHQEEKWLLLLEVTETGPETTHSMLGFLKAWGEEKDLETLVSRVSHLEPVNQHLTQLGGVEKTPYAWQVKVVDHLVLFKKLIPLFERRLRNSGYRDLTGVLNFNFRRFTIKAEIEGGTFKEMKRIDDCSDRSIGLNPYVFPKLLLGYKGRGELEGMYPDLRVRESHRGVVDVLFPVGPSFIHLCY